MTGSALAGALLGVAVAFRFSEAVFLPAALLVDRSDGWKTRAALFFMVALLTAAMVLGVSDVLYWGRPWSSIAAAVHYTIIQRQSSRGFEPPWEYLRIVPAWSTFMFVTLAIAGSSRRNPDAWWLWVPIAFLSVFPHKESRYLIPVIPFLSLAAARGFVRAVAWLDGEGSSSRRRRWMRGLFAPLLLLSLVQEVGGWRLVRSNEGVRLARYVRATGVSGVAAQDVWRLGGRPYLWPLEPISEVTPEALINRDATALAVRDARCVALRSRTARMQGDLALLPLGFERDPRWTGDDYVLYRRTRSP